MARTYIAVPVTEERATEALGQALSGYREGGKEAAALGYTGPPRILRLRDPGPILRERDADVMFRIWEQHTRRLDALEEELRRVPEQIMPALQRAHDDAARIMAAAGPESGILERLAAMEADILDHRTRIGDLEREPAPVRTEPGGAPADPDRLAKVAFRAADKLTTWESLPGATQDIYRAIAAAVAEACVDDKGPGAAWAMAELELDETGALRGRLVKEG